MVYSNATSGRWVYHCPAPDPQQTISGIAFFAAVRHPYERHVYVECVLASVPPGINSRVFFEMVYSNAISGRWVHTLRPSKNSRVFLQRSATCMNGTCTWNAGRSASMCLHLVDVFNRGIALTALLEAGLLTCKVVLSAAVAEWVAQTRPEKRGALARTDGLGALEFVSRVHAGGDVDLLLGTAVADRTDQDTVTGNRNMPARQMHCDAHVWWSAKKGRDRGLMRTIALLQKSQCPK